MLLFRKQEVYYITSKDIQKKMSDLFSKESARAEYHSNLVTTITEFVLENNFSPKNTILGSDYSLKIFSCGANATKQQEGK